MDSIKKIESFTENMDFYAFKSDDKTNFAVIRCFEIIGEATKNIPNQVKIKHKSVPWKEMAAIRDKLIHGYFGVNLEVVWKTIKEDLTRLIPLLIKILKETEQLEQKENID